MVGVMVCGSRSITDVSWVENQIVKYLKEIYTDDLDFIIINGKARGVDSIAREWAINHNVGNWDFPAEWDKYGRSAGFKRNAEMVDKCDYCLILWDGQSHGTKHDIDLCIQKGKPYKVVMYNNPRKIID